jgi:apolipoprotein N-acyltransferase
VTDRPGPDDRSVNRVGAGRWIAAGGAGLAVALALPPWGWWPTAFVGIAILDHLIADRPPRTRAGLGFVFAVVWFSMGMAWMWFLTAPGYVVATLIFAGFVAGALALCPPGPGRRLALPAVLVLQEWLRFRIPFGGVPLASLAIGQAAGPLAPLARVGGTTVVSAATVIGGQTLAALVPWVRGCWRIAWRPVAGGAAALALALATAGLAPHGQVVGQFRLALIQGGGPQGTHAEEGGPAEAAAVLQRHLDASATVRDPVDLVLWPENTVNIQGRFAGSPQEKALQDLAARLGVPISVGIVEDEPRKPFDHVDRFTNAQLVILPDGRTVSRYDKVHRVPFGEYMPLRGLLKTLGAPVDLVPKDAVSGRGPAVIDVPTAAGPVRAAVAISYEIFFGDRARDGVNHGGLVLFNPTNGSSYTGTVLQSQQVASSRLRAIETGRWVAQCAPTGFSAFISPDGTVFQRSGVSERKVLERTVALRSGRTWYVVLGDHPWAALALGAVIGAWFLARRAVVRPRSTP